MLRFPRNVLAGLLLAAALFFTGSLTGVAAGQVDRQADTGMITFDVRSPTGASITFCVFIDSATGLDGRDAYREVTTGDEIEIETGSYVAHFTMASTKECPNRSFEYGEQWWPAAGSRDFAEPISVFAARNTTVAATLGTPATIAGQFTSADVASLEACAEGAAVVARRAEGEGAFSRFAVESRAGRYTVIGPAGRYTITARCGGKAVVPAPERPTVRVGPGDRRKVDLPVVASTTLEVTAVRLETGQALAKRDYCLDVLYPDGRLYEAIDRYWVAPSVGAFTPDLANGRYRLRVRDCRGLGFQPQYYGASVVLSGATIVEARGGVIVVTVPVAARDLRCAGRLPTMLGTPNSDLLTGTDGPDVILGFGGDDFISAGAGNDIVCAGAGNDTVFGGAGHDQLQGQDGSDILRGGNGIDHIRGGRGNDELHGERGVDKLMGGPGADAIDGGEKRDIGDYRLAASGVIVNLGVGRGSAGEANGDRLVSIEKLAGSPYDDTLIGDDTNNVLFGWGGDDVLNGMAGIDVCRFGEVVTNCERD